MTSNSLKPRSLTAPLASPEVVRSRRIEMVGRLALAAVGFAPIVALALSLIEVVPLHIGGPVLVTAALAVGVVAAAVAPSVRRPSAVGLVGGLIAVLLYDCTRLPFAIFGGWPDFIPRIGAWLLHQPDAHWAVGYLWRYLGNGAGMGLAFTMLTPLIAPGLDRRVAGVLFGIAVWCGLLATLLVAPDGEGKMFVLTPATLSLSLVGHLVYGSVLGAIGRGFLGPIPNRRPRY